MKKDSDVGRVEEITRKAGKDYGFDDGHDPKQPAKFWFQQSDEGLILFVVFYSLACQWSRCLGCNLPSAMSRKHVDFKDLMAQVDCCIRDSSIAENLRAINKVIISNNGSILDERTFSSTALMYLLAQLNLHMPNLKVLSLETRPEFVDLAELEFLARAIREGESKPGLEIAIGIEAYDEHIRNDVFCKGVSFETIESLVADMAPYGFRLKCYFMQKPIMDMSDEGAVADIHRGIDYLDGLVKKYGIPINMHLNPTYVAGGTILEKSFLEGKYHPPSLLDVARAAAYGKDRGISIFIGLSDEGLAVPGGSFLRDDDHDLVKTLERFNQTQDFEILKGLTEK